MLRNSSPGCCLIVKFVLRDKFNTKSAGTQRKGFSTQLNHTINLSDQFSCTRIPKFNQFLSYH